MRKYSTHSKPKSKTWSPSWNRKVLLLTIKCSSRFWRGGVSIFLILQIKVGKLWERIVSLAIFVFSEHGIVFRVKQIKVISSWIDGFTRVCLTKIASKYYPDKRATRLFHIQGNSFANASTKASLMRILEKVCPDYCGRRKNIWIHW